MKFSKSTMAVCLLSIFLLVSGAAAQTTTMDSVESPTQVNLNSVCIVNNMTATDNGIDMLNAWAVGDGGIIVFWDGSSWTTQDSPTALNLYSVIFTDVNNGWAVGGSGDTGVILHYDGTWAVWDQISFSGYTGETDTINATLYSVTMVTDGSVGWAVGSNGIALSWDEASNTWFGFTDVSQSTLRGVAMLHGANDAWMVGDSGTIIHWDGSSFNTMTSSTIMPLYTISLLNSTNAVAAGGSGDEGIVLMLSDDTWNMETNFNFGTGGDSTLNSTIYSMDFANSTSGWAAGSNGFIMYWDGSEWSCDSNMANVDLNGVSMVHSATNGSLQAWVVGDSGTIMAFNGMEWVPELSMFAVLLLMSIGLVAVALGKAKLLRKPLLSR